MENSLIRKIQALSRKFYIKNQWRVVSIILVGSLAREEELTERHKPFDIDITLVSNFYDILLKHKFQKYLKNAIPTIESEVGLYPLSRARIEKSLYIYDLKHHGKVLAGKDIRSLIPEISIEDLYPFEGFRLLFNRGKDLIKAVKDCSPEGVTINPDGLDIAVSRIKRAYVDSHLIFRKKYDPDFNRRMRIFFSLGEQIPRIEEFEDIREMLLEGINDGLEETGINSYEKLFHFMRKEFRYPFQFRLYIAFTLKSGYALFSNPIFNAYKDLVYFLVNGSVKKKWIDFKKEVLRNFKAPQPLLRNYEYSC